MTSISVAGAGGSSYNPTPQPYLYVPSGFDRGWKTARSSALSGISRVMCIGDSIYTGSGNGTWGASTLATSWGQKLKSALLAKYSLSSYGDYWPRVGYSVGAALGQVIGGPWSDALNASAPTVYASGGWHRDSYSSLITAIWHNQFTTPYPCTALDILYFDNNAGTWQYQVDAAAAVTVTNVGNGGVANNASIKRVSITGLANTAHTVNVGQQSANAVCEVMGIATYTGNGLGLAWSNMACAGAAANDYDSSTATQFPADRVRLLQGPNPNGGAGGGTGFGFPTGADLLIIALGVNDAVSTGDATGVYQRSLTRMLNTARFYNSNATVVLVGSCFPDPSSTDVTPAVTTNVQSYPAYLQVMRNLAIEYGCAFLDVHRKWVPYPFASGYMSSGNIHPIDAGHADIASTIASIL